MKLLKILLPVLFITITSYGQGYFVTPKALFTEEMNDVLAGDFGNKVILSLGRIGIGTLTPEVRRAKIVGENTESVASGNELCFWGRSSYTGTTGGRWTLGGYFEGSLDMPSGSYDGRVYGIQGIAFDKKVTGVTWSGTNAQLVGLAGIAYNNTNNTTPTAIGVWGEVNIAQVGSITNGYSFYASYYKATSGTITNYYGFYNRGPIGSAVTNRWQFYGSTTDPSYFGGDVRAGAFRLNALNTAPAASTSTGTLGEIRIDANYIYICVATNTWKRVALNETTW